MVITAHEKFRVIHHDIEYEFEVAEEGGYIARVPLYPSAVTQGETFEEALEMVADALRECLLAARELGLEIPPELESQLAESSGTTWFGQASKPTSRRTGFCP